MPNHVVVTILLCSLLKNPAAQAQEAFASYFTDQTMRIDYHHIADAKTESLVLDRIYVQGSWAGSRKNLIDPLDYGGYRVELRDLSNKRLLYSRGFDTYCAEYMTTALAKQQKRSFHESALVPLAKKPILFRILKQVPKNQPKVLFEQQLDPGAVDIIREPLIQGVVTKKIHGSRDPHKAVDIAILGDGYRKQETNKFFQQTRKIREALFAYSPFREQKLDFNLYAVLKPSDQSGCDHPRRGIFRQTALGTTFNSLGLDRYLLTEENRQLRDVAAHVPYDVILILVNTQRYGGGGIYNLFATIPASNRWFTYITIHEFGHLFAGLADEYFTSDVAYEGFYPTHTEPKEPNITALLDPHKLKWARLKNAEIPIPTPWNKQAYLDLELPYQQKRREFEHKIAQHIRAGGSPKQLARYEAEYEQFVLAHSKKLDQLLASEPNRKKVGAFEGAGYSAHGLYRPEVDCIMFRRSDNTPFCKVCQQAIQERIRHYCE